MENFWKNKNVLITGINGFIGGNLAKTLIKKGTNVFGLIRNADQNSLLYFDGYYKNVVLIEGELTNKTLMDRIISEEDINVIFHLAAQVEVGIAASNPFLTFETNIRGTYTLLEAVRNYPTNIQAVVVASSDKAYGSYNPDMMPYKETYPLIPEYPYDTSKACADMVAKSYASDLYDLPIVITRFCNIYGPGQLNFSALIPDGIKAALGYSEFVPRSDGSMIRDFIFVEDVADLYLRIGETLTNEPQLNGEVFNAGTNQPISVKEIIKKIFKSLDNHAGLEKIVTEMEGKDAPGEIQCQYMDFEKVNEYFKWQPKHNLDDGLAKTIEWFTRYLKSSTD